MSKEGRELAARLLLSYMPSLSPTPKWRVLSRVSQCEVLLSYRQECLVSERKGEMLRAILTNLHRLIGIEDYSEEWLFVKSFDGEVWKALRVLPTAECSDCGGVSPARMLKCFTCMSRRG